MIAQITTDPGWWGNWGLAGGIVGSLLLVGLWAFRRYWIVRLPALQAKWAAETQREESQGRLFQTLSETMPATLALHRETKELVAKVDQKQDRHLEHCRETDTRVRKIESHLGIE